MNYNNVVFEYSAGFSTQLKSSDLPEIVFSGKSNVGKSSLINKILGRKSLARTSSSPGKTATINFYRLNSCRFVDLPGYGYAKVSFEEKKKWAELIESYFNSSRKIALVIQIIDIRHELSDNDIDMLNYLIERNLPFIVVLTKKDKLKVKELTAKVEYFTDQFNKSDIDFIPVSSLNGDGIDRVKEYIDSTLSV